MASESTPIHLRDAGEPHDTGNLVGNLRAVMLAHHKQAPRSSRVEYWRHPIMGIEDILNTHRAAPDATIIAVHMEMP